jgi:hypothetical protein
MKRSSVMSTERGIASTVQKISVYSNSLITFFCLSHRTVTGNKGKVLKITFYQNVLLLVGLRRRRVPKFGN